MSFIDWLAILTGCGMFYYSGFMYGFTRGFYKCRNYTIKYNIVLPDAPFANLDCKK